MEDKIIMSIKELERVKMIEKILEKQISQVEAAKIIGVSDRQVRRLVKKVREGGIKNIIHRSRGKASPKKLDAQLKKKALQLYEEKYPDFGPTFAREKLQDSHRIQLSRESLRKLLIEAGIWQVRKKKSSDFHVWRERKHFEGEMIQIDGSHHRWLEDRLDQEICLMGYIDDATGKVFARFYEYEGVFPALDSFQSFIQENGIPKSVYIDRHSTYKTTRKATVDEDLEGSESNTQFQQVMKSIGVKVIYARSPQAKGRVERLFETLQDRLVKEMRLNGISSIQEANIFLEKYLPSFNKKFSVTAKEKEKHYKKVPTNFDCKWTFSLRTKRSIAKDYTIRCFNRLFLVKNPYLALKGQKVLVKQALNGDLQFETKTKILSVKEITQKDLELVKKGQKTLKKQLKKRPTFHKSKKSWMDKFYFGKRRVQLVK
jgi:transposase